MTTPLPNPWREYGKHEMLVDTTHDESARLDFMANLFRHVGNEIWPNHREVYDKKVEPEFKKQHDRSPSDRHEVRTAMLQNPYFRDWSHLRVYAQENTYAERRNIVNRQLDELIERAKPRPTDKGKIELDPNFEVPRYQTPLDMHWMPGSYFTEFNENEVAGGALYDLGGLYLSTGGMLGKFNNGAGYAVVRWLAENYPDFSPTQILDEGCTVGHNTLPYKDAWPDAEVTGIDIGAPVIRYGHRRTESLGYNITFSQQNAEKTKFDDGSFDFIVSTMFLHETSNRAVHNIVTEAYRLLKKGGLMLHVEQPPFELLNDPFEQLMKDWDTHNNNEPFWGTMHDMDLESVAVKAGFRKSDIVQTFAPVVRPTDADNYNLAPAGKWFIYAAWKH